MTRSLWKFLTSLRLTIVLLVCAIVLVFVGTVAQADEGLYQVQDRYFRHWILMGTTLWGFHMPWFIWPAGRLVGSALLINLVAAHIKRFQWSTSKLGIHLTHLGIIILLLGQLATDFLQVESQMILNEGDTDNYIQRTRYPELAFTTDTDKDHEQVVAVPHPLIVKGGTITNPNLPFTVKVKEYASNGEVVSHQKALAAAVQITTALATLDSEFSTVDGIVPQAERAAETPGRVDVWRAALKAVGETDVQDIVAAAKKVAAQPDKEGKLRTELKARFRAGMLGRFSNMPDNEDPTTARGMRYAASKIGAGQTISPETLPPASTEGAGSRATIVALPEVKDMDTRAFPYAVLEFEADGKSLGTWLMSTDLRDQPVTVGDKTVRVALREQRQYLPYSIKLVKATHKIYAGSDIPKDFRSRVLIENPVSKESRETEISMNDPLRYNGLAYYQYQMTKDEFDRSPGLSVLQVVHNPSWLVPYIGCIVVASGMLWQFLHHLVAFIKKRRPV
ncbi:MAG: cytochrome c biogenesis protein ResB [Chthoniobacter sp.]|uniref:cytochrome c biogenesis protein ResB n=1 Tax=Chthoniobacter sp. TaxID=2510640 RepID=UPI0032AE794E